MTLGSNVTAWAKDKLWLLDHSLVVGKEGSWVRMWQKFGASVHYSLNVADGGTVPPQYVPAKFTVALGAGPDAAAPLPYVAHSAFESNYSFSYSRTNLFRKTETLRGPALGDTFP